MSFTHHNHYVPEWYQKRFLPPGEGKYFFLKLQPSMVIRPDGGRHREKALHRWGPRTCFYQDDLYTTRFGAAEDDDIERHLFGRIDDRGKSAVEFFMGYSVQTQSNDRIRGLMDYMDAQVLRTPRGLARVRLIARSQDHNLTLLAMQQLRQMHLTMWLECVWEIIDTNGSGIDLVVSDNPVTFYNRGLFPGTKECRFPWEPELALLGTQTLFPLSPDKLLVLTHVQFARDPRYDPKKPRINPRVFAETFFPLSDVITGSRKLDSEGVSKVNYIIKQRAHEYIAASTEAGLYPERALGTTHWSKLGEAECLLPDPREVGFSSTILCSDERGNSWGYDEYGRPPSRDEMKDPYRTREWDALHRRQAAWDKRFGKLGHFPAHMRNLRPTKKPPAGRG